MSFPEDIRNVVKNNDNGCAYSVTWEKRTGEVVIR